MAHAPIAPSQSEGDKGRAQASRDEEIESELVAVVTSMGQNDKIHPTRAATGEVLPEGFSWSYTEFPLCNNVLDVEVNQAIVKKDSEYLQKHAIVAYFVGGKQFQMAIAGWVDSLQKQVGDWVEVGRNLGPGFFQIISHRPAITQKLLMLTPLKSCWRTCILQT